MSITRFKHGTTFANFHSCRTTPVASEKLKILANGWAKLAQARFNNIGDISSGPQDLCMLSSERSFLTSGGVVEMLQRRKSVLTWSHEMSMMLSESQLKLL